MDNQQLYNLTDKQLQTLIVGKFGDGHLTSPKTKGQNSRYVTNSIHQEYINYKHKLLGNIVGSVSSSINQGFKKSEIHTLQTKSISAITEIRKMSIEEALKFIHELGLALWFYDDGSLHKKHLFYNLNTHKFERDVQEDLFKPFLKQFDIYADVISETKKDGRKFYYLTIRKYKGAHIITQLLKTFKVNCFNYKLWSPEAIQKWSKLQEELKRRGNTRPLHLIKPMVLANIWRRL